MNGNFELLAPILFPIICGIAIVPLSKFNKSAKMRIIWVGIMGACALLTLYNALTGDKQLFIWNITDGIPIMLKLDLVGKFFSVLVAAMWLLVSIFSTEYMKHEERQSQFYGFYLITYGVIMGLDYSGSLMTFYLFYELMTMITVTLVIHSRKKEAVSASFKYLIYSLFGAFMGLLGIFFVHKFGSTLEFIPGGVMEALGANKELMLVIAFITILGFSTKAGLFPLHGWLPAAHPVAPAPASAVLSGIITKAGVLGLIRVVYYIFGADFIRGTWVQAAWIWLTLITVIMGSMMAYKDKVLKRRLAYSTVSQVSYILFGLALLEPMAFTGALMHVVFHSIIKIILFLSAGAIIYKTGITNVDELKGVGQKMPLTMICYSIAALGLIGIPPLNGFISKWYLASGALNAHIPIISVVGPAILLVSALLTAGYLLPITLNGFFTGKEFKRLKKDDVSLSMVIPMGVLALATIFFGIFPGGLAQVIQGISSAIFF